MMRSVLALALLVACASACEVEVTGGNITISYEVTAGKLSGLIPAGTAPGDQYEGFISLCNASSLAEIEATLGPKYKNQLGVSGSEIFVNAAAPYIFGKGISSWSSLKWKLGQPNAKGVVDSIVGTATGTSGSSLELNLECTAAGTPAWGTTSKQVQETYQVYVTGACVPKAGPGGSGGKKSSGLSGGWVFVIILLVTSFVYCVGGCVFKSQRKGTTGSESIPNVDFWRGLPGLVKDGVKFVFSGCKRQGGYDQVE